VPALQKQVEVCFKGVVPDGGSEAQLKHIYLVADAVLVAAGLDGSGGVKAVVEFMAPAQGAHAVAPVEAKLEVLVVKAEEVAPVVPAQGQLIVLAGFVRQFTVEVVEIIIRDGAVVFVVLTEAVNLAREY